MAMATKKRVVDVSKTERTSLTTTTVSLGKILEHEKIAEATYWLAEDHFNGKPPPRDEKPAELVARVCNFAVLSSDLALCGETSRFEDVFFRAFALLDSGAVEGEVRLERARNAVRRARIEIREKREAEKQAKEAARENMKRNSEAKKLKLDTKQYLKSGTSYKK